MKCSLSIVQKRSCIFLCYSRWHSRWHSSHFLPHFHPHFAPAAQHFLDAVEELEEGVLAVDDEARRTGLAHQDAALAKGERTIARLQHRTRDGVELGEMTTLVMLALVVAKLASGGWLRAQEQHLALMNPTLGDAYEILAGRHVATLTLHGVADALTLDEIATTI